MMKRQIAAACALIAVLSQSAWAADYTFYGPEQGLFARPTSDNTIYVDKPKINVDRSKNTALIPPGLWQRRILSAWQRNSPDPEPDPWGQRDRFWWRYIQCGGTAYHIGCGGTAYHIGQHQYGQHRLGEL